MVALPHPLTRRPFPSPVAPGTGWPGDQASAETLVAHDAGEVRDAAAGSSLAEVTARSSVCRACPRLVGWREDVAVGKRAAFAGQPYWGRPVTGWGADRPAVLVLGLAPAAHGGNRTGRIFTGDRSGDWLFASLHRVGLAAQATSVAAGDGQRLRRTRLVAAVRCAPPGNRPTVTERDTCAGWLDREVALVLPSVRVVVCLGGFAWSAALRALVRTGCTVPRPRPRFGHGAEAHVSRPPADAAGAGGAAVAAGAAGAAGVPGVAVLGSYHPSQQNTFTGRLTEPMLDEVLGRAAALAALG